MNFTERLESWSAFINNIRHFFTSRGYLEVSTPTLVPAGAFEATIDTLKVNFRQGSCELHSSPEFEMKRWVAETKRSLFQVCKCYRDDPATGHHLKEFTMLEYYRVGATYKECQSEVEELLGQLSARPLNWKRMTVRDAVLRLADIDLAETQQLTVLREAAKKTGVIATPSDDWADVFFKILIQKVEPALDPAEPTMLTDYPAQVAALAKLSTDTRWCERFEIYWQGLELCNGATELTDLIELKRRSHAESQTRSASAAPSHPPARRLEQALEHGLPSCAGVAIGLERLFACLTGEPVTHSSLDALSGRAS